MANTHPKMDNAQHNIPHMASNNTDNLHHLPNKLNLLVKELPQAITSSIRIAQAKGRLY